MILRVCVQRHLRLPQELMVDRGADFGSVYFETLLTRYSVTKKERPPAQPRFGSVLERLFGTTNTMLLNQLRGNTQATKTPRQMTREVDPKQHAVWTLERFSERFAEWAYDIYDQMEHPRSFKALVMPLRKGWHELGRGCIAWFPTQKSFSCLHDQRPTQDKQKSTQHEELP